MLRIEFDTDGGSFRSFLGEVDELFCRVKTVSTIMDVVKQIEDERVYDGPVVDGYGNVIGHYEFDWSE